MALNDWEIIGTFCNYCNNYHITELFFISHNYKEFADIENHDKIHPTIQKRFPKTIINYFKNIIDFFNYIKSNDDFVLMNTTQNSNPEFSYKSTLKKTDIDSLYYLFHEKYQEINFIPTFILGRYYPFTDSEESKVHHNLFTLYSVRENVGAFFEKVNIIEGKSIKIEDANFEDITDDCLMKTEYVLRHLTNNLVSYLSLEKNRKLINIHYFQLTECDCCRCSFNSFEFKNTFSIIKETPYSTNLKDNLKVAFINYKMGNYATAFNLYIGILKDSLPQKKYITNFIAHYNLKQISKFIFFNEGSDNELIKIFRKIDLKQEAQNLKSKTDYNLLSHIVSDDFFNYPFQNIAELSDELVSDYYTVLNGGFSTNQSTLKMIEVFAKIEAFINDNYIIYDIYSNFHKLFELFTKGLFASHAISDKSQNRLNFFDEYLIRNFLFYGKKDTIIEYFYRFNLKSLKYKNVNSEKDLFLEIAFNILGDYKYTQAAIENYADKDSERFHDKFNSIFENLLTMASLLDIDTCGLNKFAQKLIAFLKEEPPIYHYCFSSIKSFFNRKGKSLENELLNEFFLFYLDKIDTNEPLFESIVNSFEDNSNIKITPKKLTELSKKLLKNDSQFLLYNLYTKVNSKNKKIVQTIISKSLETTFVFEHYYQALLYDIITFDRNMLFKLINNVELNNEGDKLRNSFFGSRNDYQKGMIDKLINLCFKFNIKTNTKRFERLKEIHPYYRWLLDMRNFDYTTFDTEWVLNYPTIYYHNAMSKSKETINALVESLKKQSNEAIAKALVEITYFSKIKK